MRFWDTSAVIPMLVEEATTQTMLSLLASDSGITVWWGTEVECTSALARREREAEMTGEDIAMGMARLARLKADWHEVDPVEPIRRTAHRLLRTHPLRAADALQLSAALAAAEGDPSSLEFVCLDGRLVEAARREGLVVVEIPSPSG